LHHNAPQTPNWDMGTPGQQGFSSSSSSSTGPRFCAAAAAVQEAETPKLGTSGCPAEAISRGRDAELYGPGLEPRGDSPYVIQPRGDSPYVTNSRGDSPYVVESSSVRSSRQFQPSPCSSPCSCCFGVTKDY
jgi:hypothetical protein